MRLLAICTLAALAAGCAAPVAEETETTTEELSLPSSDAFYVALARCGAAGVGVSGLRLDVATTATCLSDVVASPKADTVTAAAVARLGVVGDTQVFRVDANVTSGSSVKQVFSLAGSPWQRLDQAVTGLGFYQVSSSSCGAGAIFSALAVNDPGFLESKVQRAWGTGDVVVSFEGALLPPGYDADRVRREVLYEQAVFRGQVYRPTFDILHPFAARPLVVTVFDLLPRERSADRCP